MLGRGILVSMTPEKKMLVLNRNEAGGGEGNKIVEEILMLYFENFLYICADDGINFPHGTSTNMNTIKIIIFFSYFASSHQLQS